jgi:hypothetical protein
MWLTGTEIGTATGIMIGTETVIAAIAGATATAMTADILTAMTAGIPADMTTTADTIETDGVGMGGAGGTGTVIAGSKDRR